LNKDCAGTNIRSFLSPLMGEIHGQRLIPNYRFLELDGGECETVKRMNSPSIYQTQFPIRSWGGYEHIP
jgi:hypothetical protein